MRLQVNKQNEVGHQRKKIQVEESVVANKYKCTEIPSTKTSLQPVNCFKNDPDIKNFLINLRI